MESLGFPDMWLWLIFVIAGLLLVSLELFIGIEAGLDLVILGSASIIGGLVTWPLHSWVYTVVITSVICIAYIVLGRTYVHRQIAVKETKTNVDAIIGRNGIVLQGIAKNVDGLVKVNNEQWRARAEEDIEQGVEIVVTGISGTTLVVKKTKGSS
ncbi:MAG: NfeD family protein [Chloroflexota bacterium]|nr:NfeD family protein [Chloroflexota bacterium]